MSTSRPFALNTGSTISGTTQIGNIAIGDNNTTDFSTNPGGVQWWMGPNESLGHIIVVPVPDINQPTPIGNIGGVQFWRSSGVTESSFLDITNIVAKRKNQTPFTGSTEAIAWLSLSGYPTTYPYEFESVALFKRMDEQPSDALKSLINITIKGLKDDGVWDLSDCLYVRGVHTAQAACLNWIKNAHNSTLVNSPTFTQKVGFSGDGTAKYITNDYNLKTGSINYKVNDCSLVIMMPVIPTNSTFSVPLGVRETAVPAHTVMRIYPSTGSDRFYFNAQTQIVFQSDGGEWKYFGFTRSGNDELGYINGVPTYSEVDVVDTVLANLIMREMAANNDGSMGTPINGTIAFTYYGAGLNATKQLAIYTRMKYFYDNIGGTF